MPAGGDRGAPTRWILLAAVLLVSAAAATSLQDASQSPGQTVTGDLLLADDDEGPRNGVEETFKMRNMAPGDETTGVLTVIRESPAEQGTRVLEPRLELEIRHEEHGGLEDALLVRSFRYGDTELVDELERECGAILTIRSLAHCTQQPEHPLSSLPDPTPEGRDLVVTFALDEGARNEVQSDRVFVLFEATLTQRVAGTDPPALPEPNLEPAEEASPVHCPALAPLPQMERATWHRIAPDRLHPLIEDLTARELLRTELPFCYRV